MHTFSLCWCVGCAMQACESQGVMPIYMHTQSLLFGNRNFQSKECLFRLASLGGASRVHLSLSTIHITMSSFIFKWTLGTQTRVCMFSEQALFIEGCPQPRYIKKSMNSLQCPSRGQACCLKLKGDCQVTGCGLVIKCIKEIFKISQQEI